MNFEPGNFYHIFNRGNNSQKVFFNRENYLFFLRKMNEHLFPYSSIVAWCLMPNHFHWVIYVHHNIIEITEDHAMTSRHSMIKHQKANKNSHTMAESHSMTRQPTKTRTFNYSIGILLRSYTRAIQKQQNIAGSLFQQHTEAKPLTDQIEITPSYWNTTFGTLINIPEGKSYLETCIEYIHQNPVYSKLVMNAQDWEFSSIRDYLGLRDGKLIDYELLLKEKLLSSGHAMTSRHSMTKTTIGPNEEVLPATVTHSMTSSHTMTNSNNTVVIGIGSNIDPEKNIPKMLDILKMQVEVVKVSSFIVTKPIGITNQADFTNGAVKVKTNLDQEKLKSLLKTIEDELGRDRSVPKFGPRNIDLDIVVWNGEIVDDDYYTRDFLQKSVQEIL